MEKSPKFLIVRNFRTASDPDNPHVAYFEIATDPAGEEHNVFVADATMLDGLATASANPAKAIRNRSN